MAEVQTAVQATAVPNTVKAFRFDGSVEGAKALRDWAQNLGADASTFSWPPQLDGAEARVRVNGMVVQPGSWAVYGPVWQVLVADRFEAAYRVVAA